jgi:hypothetical protein
MAAPVAGPAAGPPAPPGPAAAPPAQAIDNAMILSRTGREYGPDFMLNVKNNPMNGDTITPQSSITEVLNIVGYMCNITRDDDSTINNEGSLDKNTYGKHDDQGYYVDPVDAAGDTLYLSAPVQLFDLDTFTANPPAADAFIPQGILIRKPNPAGLHIIKDPVTITQANITTLMSDCVKQMINILTKTREIFGPKGWTALFNQVKGGGAGSKHAKRTHRQHRRRYSSKQY